MDYSTDPDANRAACDAAEQFASDLDHDPSYGSLAIVTSGLRVYVVSPPSALVSGAITAMRTLVPVETQVVRHSWRELMQVADRLHADSAAW